MLNAFTVALYYGGEYCDYSPAERLYVATGVLVPALSSMHLTFKEAVERAKIEAAKAWAEDSSVPVKPKDFQLLCVFEGKQDPVAFGFQPGLCDPSL
jgi:hypothetical protein